MRHRIIQTCRREPALVHDRRGAGLQHHPKVPPRACFGTRPSWRRPLASSKPAAASLLWYTTAAVHVFSIIQKCRREPALVHVQARLLPSLLPKVFALTLLWCMGLTRCEASHHPKVPPRACFGTRPPWRRPLASSNLPPRAYFGTRPPRRRPSASSKPFAACLLWYTPQI